MKFCPNCRAEVKENAKFCTKCGFNLEEYRVSFSEEDKSEQELSNENHNHQRAPNYENDVGEAFKNYWSFFMRTLINPSTTFDERGSNNNGLIQFAIIALLFSLSQVFFTLTFNFVDSFGVFISYLILSLAFILITVGVIYLLKRFLQKTQITYRETATQFGGLFSGGVLILALYLLMSMIAPFGLVIPILLLGVLFTAISIAAFNIYLFYSPRNYRSAVGPYYTTLIGNIIMIIIIMVLLRILLGYAANNLALLIEEMMYQMFYGYY